MPLFKRNLTPKEQAAKKLRREVKAAWERCCRSPQRHTWQRRYFCIFQRGSSDAAFFYRQRVVDFRQGTVTYCIDVRGNLYRGYEDARHYYEYFLGSRSVVERLEQKATAEAQRFARVNPWGLNLAQLNEYIELVKTFAT